MKTMLLSVTALALVFAPVPPAQACQTCAKHNTSTAPSEGEHGHEHPDEEEGFVTILGEGHTDGWTFDDEWFSINEDGVMVAGHMEGNIPRTLYAHYETEYYNFELRLQVKLEGPRNGNGGVQFRSEVREEQNDMRGYQADMGAVYWGRLYDQSRGRGLLTEHPQGYNIREEIKHGDWNDYVIRCEGARIQVWINGTLTADYTEADEEIARQTGLIGLQMHGGPPSIRYYRSMRIKELD
ncbi:MAG: DUF1080 domain-containing protein [Planctomycetota bacterium]